MVSVIVTLVLMALAVYTMIKKINPTISLLLLGLVTLFFYSLITKHPLLGDKTTGVAFLDLWDFTVNIAIKQFSGAIMTVMSVMAYIAYLEKLQASTYFAWVVCKPLQKLKAPYLLAAMTIVLGAFLKMCIPSAVSMITLLLATIYPVLRRLGVSKATAASALVLCGLVVWGPADSLITTVLGLGGITNFSTPEFFIKYGAIGGIAEIVVMVVMFIIVSRIFDKKENASKESEELEIKDFTKDASVPKVYFILPLLPLILATVFSAAFMDKMVISVAAANYMSFVIAIILNMICTKRFVEVLNETKAFFAGMGKYVGGPAFLIVSGSVFAEGIKLIGGFSYLVTILTDAGGSGVLLIVLASIIFFPVIACTGSIMATMTIFVPLFQQIAIGTGINPLVGYAILLFLSGLATGLTPIAASMIVVSGATETDVPTIMKRNAIPVFTATIVVMILR